MHIMRCGCGWAEQANLSTWNAHDTLYKKEEKFMSSNEFAIYNHTLLLQ